MPNQIDSLAKWGGLSKLENLSPLALKELRDLAFRERDGFLRQNAAAKAQRKLSDEIAMIKHKMAPWEEEMRLLQLKVEPNEETVAKVHAVLEPMRRKLSGLLMQRDVVVANKEVARLEVAPDRALLARLLEFMKVRRADDLFPDLPHDSNQEL